MAGEPPADVKLAASKVEAWLQSQAQAAAAAAPTRVSDEVFAKMSPAARLDHCRKFQQFKPVSPR